MNSYGQLLIDQISREIISFENEDVLLTDKIKFNQFKILKKILQHQNNTFETAYGGKRFFFNIVKDIFIFGGTYAFV